MVGVWASVPVKGPLVPDLVDLVQVQFADEELLVLVRTHLADELTPRIDEIGGAVEVVVRRLHWRGRARGYF